MADADRSRAETDAYDAELLLVLPVCLARDERGLLFELQACRGIEQWLESFSRLRLVCPLLSDEEFQRSHSIVWKPVSEIAGLDRVEFVPLPYAVSLSNFTRDYLHGRAIIRREIERSRYLCFAIGGLFGDWGAVACLEAKRLGRPYAVWTDRVEHKVVRATAGGNWLRRLKNRVRSRLMYWLERRCIRHASLGLFHGASCHSQYAPWCKTSYLVQDFPINESDLITTEQLDEKCSQLSGPLRVPLRIGYAGRADEMKGPFDWLDIMESLHQRGVSFKATWLGDGPLLAEMRNQVVTRGLSDVVFLPGFVSSRSKVMEFLRSIHVLVFCHRTPESPRCLVEALMSGTGIVGYESEYASELTIDVGGVLVQIGNNEQIVKLLCALDSDRSWLAGLSRAACQAVEQFNEKAGFEYRSRLIKTHL